MSPRAWRRAVLVWVVAVAVGGALTVWLRDSAEQSETYGRYGTGDGDPAPQQDVEEACPKSPGGSPSPEAFPTDVLCVYVTTP
ncbi:hypothetical protein [Streptomyces sp. SID12488]|uniref:hypothetical protein n=1 Tax=Streptomyces sp. SID12488 TaxID=2706040 RepID=UPI0013DC461D|nr:hypothetical protein [Streptomyces sp. SID12488]NEA63665.1 hypothetical protein [Streptomyces sp. SID12488]